MSEQLLQLIDTAGNTTYHLIEHFVMARAAEHALHDLAKLYTAGVIDDTHLDKLIAAIQDIKSPLPASQQLEAGHPPAKSSARTKRRSPTPRKTPKPSYGHGRQCPHPECSRVITHQARACPKHARWAKDNDIDPRTGLPRPQTIT